MSDISCEMFLRKRDLMTDLTYNESGRVKLGHKKNLFVTEFYL